MLSINILSLPCLVISCIFIGKFCYAMDKMYFTRLIQVKTLNIFYLIIYWTQKVHNDFIFLHSLHCAATSFTVTRRFSFVMASAAAMASDVTTRCAWPAQGESVTELMPFMDFLVHSYTCCSDRHATPYWTFIRRQILMGFTPSLLKKRMTECCSSLVHVTNGAVIFTLLLCRHVGHSSNHEYHYCQLTRQSSCVSNFYRTF